MPKIFHDIKVGLDEDLREKIELLQPHFQDYRVLRQSIDARRSRDAHFVYSVEVASQGEVLHREKFEYEALSRPLPKDERPIIVGTGPAGLFCALRLLERGIPSRIFERGSPAEKRIMGINQFWRYGKLDPRNNVCFGEGGAGLYSDGKLITRIKSPHIPYVMRRLVEFGAPAEIEYLANPHVGSDRLRRVIPFLRKHLNEKGCDVHFDTQVTDILVSPTEKRITGIKTEYGKEHQAPFVVLATGHSASDMLNHLAELGVELEGKSFAMGLRIEHPQKSINRIQYRDSHEHPKLSSANYKLAYHDHDTQIGVYSFCMCPGGYVLSSGTEADGLVCNGMSNFRRNSPFANSAIVITIDSKEYANKFSGMTLRRDLEKKAFQAVPTGSHALPVQKLTDFLDRKKSINLGAHSCPSGAASSRLDQIVPESLFQSMYRGIEDFEKKMKGFISPEAQLFGVESRTSCPLRVPRDPESLQSVSHSGLYPAGEGAGYAGGITSAAVDGIRIADAIYAQLKS